jgi:hypothetical protein
MRYSGSEIVEDILEHIRQAGGELRDWRVGMAPDAQAPLFRQHAMESSPEKLIYREAYTTFAAEEVVERLTQGFELPLAQEATANGTAPRRPGKLVFVYRPVTVASVAQAQGTRS